jgi:hypothetical protein
MIASLHRSLLRLSVLIGVHPWFLCACGSPNQANIELRKEKQSLEHEIDQLKSQVAADRARIQGLESQVGTVPTLPQSRLNEMFTVHGFRIGRLTGGADLQPNNPNDGGLRVFVTPFDDDGHPIQATGTLTVEAFDLEQSEGSRIGRWVFTPEQLKRAWQSFALIHGFVVDCPWQKLPTHAEIALKITFDDALTGGRYSELYQARVHLPPRGTTQPSTSP